MERLSILFTSPQLDVNFHSFQKCKFRWSVIAAQLPGRTDNDIKNYWNTKLKKKLMTMLPPFQDKQTFIPSMSFQAPPSLPSYEHHTSHQFLNTPYYTFTPPNFMNLDNTSNSLLVHNDHTSIMTNLQSPPPPPSNILISNNNIDVIDNCYNHLGFQDEHHSICNSPMQDYYHNASTMKEGMLMFGSTSCSSSENGSYNKDLHQKQQYQIKQEHGQITLHDQVLGDQLQNHSFMIDQKPKDYMFKNHATPSHNDIEEVKQLNFTSYLLHDGDESKIPHFQKGVCSYYY